MSVTLRAAAVTVVRDRREVLRGADIRIRPGEVHGIIGPNGAGKSTLLRSLASTLRARSGAVLVSGGEAGTSGPARHPERDMSRISARQRARIRALLPQDAGHGDDMRVRDVVALGRYAHRGSVANAADRALERVGIAHLADRDLRTLSGGQRRLAFIAKALAQDPRILLLDEPLAALDPRFSLDVLRIVREQAAAGVGVGVVLHDLEVASRVCARVTVVADGEVVASGTPEVVLTPDLISGVYGVRAHVAPDPVAGGLRIVLTPQQQRRNSP